jgi:two-component system NtrC family response regulator
MVATGAVLDLLRGHHWPGNVRELANVIEHALVLCDELPLALDHLPARFGGLRPGPAAVDLQPAPSAAVRPESLRELEMRAILAGLERNKGNKVRTAEELGISLKTLYNKLHQLNDGTLDRTG